MRFTVTAALPLAVRSYRAPLWPKALAGVLLAVPIMIKITPGLLLLFFCARRSCRAVLGTLAGAGALLMVSLGSGDWTAWVDYLAALPGMGYGAEIPHLFPASTIYNFSLAGHLSRILPAQPQLVPSLSASIVAGLSLAVGGVSLLARGRRQELLALALFPPVLVVASPLAYLHHIVFLMPLLVIWFAWAWQGARGLMLGLFLTLAIASSVDWPGLYSLNALFSGSAPRALNLYALGLELVVGVGAFLIERRQTPAAAGMAVT